MPDWVQTIFEPTNAAATVGFMLDVTLKGLLLLVVAGLLASLLRRSSAATRHWVWCVAIAGLVCLPFLAHMLPSWRVAGLPSFERSLAQPAEAPGVESVPPASPLPPLAPVPALAPFAPLPPTPPVPSVSPGAPVPPAEAPAAKPAPPMPALRTPGSMPNAPEASAASPPLASLPPAAQKGAREDAGAVDKARETPTRVSRNAVVGGLSVILEKLLVLPWSAWLVLAWVIGAVLMIVYLLVGRISIWWLVRRSEPIHGPPWRHLAGEAGDRFFLNRDVQLRRSRAAAMPMTWGVFNPVVLLPEGADGWSIDRQRCVLLHEFAHIKRYDCLTQMVAQVACVLFWFNPLVWTASRRMQIEREKACDDLVLQMGTRASDYATHLLDIARSLRPTYVAPLGAVAMARPSQLEGRILSILNGRRRRALSRTAAAGFTVLAALLVISLAAMKPSKSASPATAAVATGKLPGSADALVPAFTRPEEPLDADTRVVVADDTWSWSGTVPEGKGIEIKGIAGDIKATLASGTQVEVRAETSAGRDDSVVFSVVEHADGVTICARYPQQPSGALTECRPGGWENVGQVEDVAPVDFAVRVPDGVRFTGRTIEGDIATTGLAGSVDLYSIDGSITAEAAGNVRAATVDGDISLRAQGWAAATTVDGDIFVEMGRTDWAGEHRLNTVDGDVALVLPRSADVVVEAKVEVDGEIRSVFPVESQGEGLGRSARATLGTGGRTLRVSTLDGTIVLRTPEQPASAARRVALAGEPGDVSGWLAHHVDVQATFSGDHEDGVHVWVDPMPLVEQGLGWVADRVQTFDFTWGSDTTHRQDEHVPDDVVASLITSLQDEDEQTRLRIIQTLGEMEAEAAVPGLATVLQSDVSEDVRGRAAWALGEIEAPAAVPALIDALDDEDRDVRRKAIWALGEIEAPESVPALSRRLQSEPDADLRSMSAWALGEIEDPRAIAGLAAAVQDVDAAVRKKAVWALGEIEAPGAVPALSLALRDADADVRCHAAWALGEIESPEAVDALIAALRDEEAAVREKVAWALGEIEAPAAVGGLSQVLINDASADVRRVAAWALGEIADPRASGALTQALKDRDRDVRRKAAWAIGELDY